jgi:hypothetical protein
MMYATGQVDGGVSLFLERHELYCWRKVYILITSVHTKRKLEKRCGLD